MHVRGPPVDQREPGRVVHPRVDGDHEEGPGDPRHRDGDAAQEMDPGRQFVPAVGVDPHEDRLDEEREPLEREAEAEDVAEVPHPHRPQQAHLERQDRPGDHADREQGQHDPGPPPGDGPVEGVAGTHVPVLDEQDEHREGNAEADQRDMHR